MRRYAQLMVDVDQTSKTSVKVDNIICYLENTSDTDKLYAIALLLDGIPTRLTSLSQIKEWAIDLSGVPSWLFDESVHVVGDLAETIALLIPQSSDSADYSLKYWLDAIKSWKTCVSPDLKEEVLSAWEHMGYNEKYLFNKLISGGYRAGISRNLVLKALSAHTGLPVTGITARLMCDWNPCTVSFEELLFKEDKRNELSKPYPFCLAYLLEQDVKALGKADDWMADYTWDGLRVQLILREGEAFIWSDDEVLLSDKFPELSALKSLISAGMVIEGEIIPLREENSAPFFNLQTRIGRKSINKKLLKDIPICLKAYDILEYEGQDIRHYPIIERKKILEKICISVNDPVLQLSEIMHENSWETVEDIRIKARIKGASGLVLKRKTSPYHVGKMMGDWWLWQVDPYKIDAVLLYASKGQGRMANLYADYTFAVWQGQQLIPFTKAYLGLSVSEYRQVDAFVRKHTLERFGPVRSVKPELVFELTFQGIQSSPRHKSGITLRYPKIKIWRKDKKATEANSINDLKNLLK